MTDKKDIELWKQMTADVKRLPGKTYQEPAKETQQNADITGQESVRETPLVAKTPEEKVPSRLKASDVDRKTEERFRRGKMPIEARLDLHGFYQDKARAALEDFLLASYERGRRCVLVITGKGKDGEGVLKQSVPGWLTKEPLNRIILKTAPAIPRDGGGGALYILLRRKRD